MKRSMLTVCAAVLAASACLVLGATGCANEVDADERDVATVGQTQQDLTLGETAAPASVEGVAATDGDEGPGGGRPQPEPWAAPATTGAAPGTGPAPDSDPRRLTSGAAVRAGGDRPQPEPWREAGSTVGLTKNQ